MRYALVDDRHFLVTGFTATSCTRRYWTESDGKRVALFPIDERLRYLIPFRPPEETGGIPARAARRGPSAGGAGRRWREVRRLARHQGVGLRARVARPLHRHDRRLVDGGEVELSTPRATRWTQVPSGGIAYLPTASYREMEGWSLPPDAALRLIRLERDLGEARMAGPDGALVRGAHWRNFLVKYSESNRMHKKMQALSRAVPRARRSARGAARHRAGAVQRRLLARGVRRAVSAAPARGDLAQSGRRPKRSSGEARGSRAEVLDLDGDGHEEIWVHSDQFSAMVSPGAAARSRSTPSSPAGSTTPIR